MTPINLSSDLRIIDTDFDKHFVILTFEIDHNYMHEKFMVYYDNTYHRCNIDFEFPTQDIFLLAHAERVLNENKVQINEYLVTMWEEEM